MAVSSWGADGWISEGNTEEVPAKMRAGAQTVCDRGPLPTALQHDSPLFQLHSCPPSLPARLSACPLAPV